VQPWIVPDHDQGADIRRGLLDHRDDPLGRRIIQAVFVKHLDRARQRPGEAVPGLAGAARRGDQRMTGHQLVVRHEGAHPRRVLETARRQRPVAIAGAGGAPFSLGVSEDQQSHGIFFGDFFDIFLASISARHESSMAREVFGGGRPARPITA
jgi:hypothetical protein